ncbi:P-type DNA transfer ATPase VirB11 [Paraburkholderia sp. SIMBA_009]
MNGQQINGVSGVQAGPLGAKGLEYGEALAAKDERSASLLTYIGEGLGEFFNDPEITDITIDYPGMVGTLASDGWIHHDRPNITADYCRNVAYALASYRKQKISEEKPLLGGTLPGGERVAIALPPATPNNEISISIRKPSRRRMSIDEIAGGGAFADTICEYDTTEEEQKRIRLAPDEQELWNLFIERKFVEFITLAVATYRKNFIASGATGSGKTTIGKAIADLIPANERLITIEDTPEMDLPKHPHRVHLFYSKGDQGVSKVTAKDLLESCLRMKPDRILLSELRSDEAYYYLRNVNSGHPGSITTIHADSALLTFTQLLLLIKDSRSGGGMTNTEIYALLHALVDVVAHFKFDTVKRKRVCTGIYFDPFKKRMAIRG